MVLTLSWTPSWAVLAISVSILFLAIAFLLLCICSQRDKKDALVPNSMFTFMKFGSKKSVNITEIPRGGSNSHLLDLLDSPFHFDAAELRVSCDCDDQDMLSCASSPNSNFSFYSTYPAPANRVNFGVNV